jgi:hypothetical protein
MAPDKKSKTIQKIHIVKFGIGIVAGILGYLLVKFMLTL